MIISEEYYDKELIEKEYREKYGKDFDREFYVGQILDGRPDTYLNDLISYKGFRYYEIDPTGDRDDVDRYIFKIGRPMSEEDNLIYKNNIENIDKLRRWFRNNDYRYFKYLRGEYTEEKWETIKARSVEKAKELNSYIDIYNHLVTKYTTPETNN